MAATPELTKLINTLIPKIGRIFISFLLDGFVIDPPRQRPAS
jgi:hypothetical protein